MNSPLTVPNGDPCCAGVGVMRHAFHLFFDKVVDVPVVRRCSSSTVMTPPWSCAASAPLLTWRMDSALDSEFKSCRQLQLIRAELPSNGSCRSHRALVTSSLPSCVVPFLFLPRLATPALRLGVIGALRPSGFYLFLCRYGRRSGQPSSSSLARTTYCRFRRLVAFYGYKYSWSSPTGTP